PISPNSVPHFVVLSVLPLPRPTLFPYTTLFRSRRYVRRRGYRQGGEALGVALWQSADMSAQHSAASGISNLCRFCGFAHMPCARSEEHMSELQSPDHLVCRLLLDKKKHPLNHMC